MLLRVFLVCILPTFSNIVEFYALLASVTTIVYTEREEQHAWLSNLGYIESIRALAPTLKARDAERKINSRGCGWYLLVSIVIA